MRRLEGKVAVVLGAAGKDNMGQAIARRFADEGASVVVAGRNAAALAEFAATIGGAHAVCDITVRHDVESLIDTAVAAFGTVDIAVNATGVGLLAPLLDTSEQQLDDILALQFKGPYFFAQAFTRWMMAHGGGSVIQITSATTVCVIENHAAYIGSKAGADAVLRCFANEFGRHGIKYNSIAPGLTESPMTQGAMAVPGLKAAFVKRYPLGRIGTADDVAAAAVWLASDESFVTGETLHVSGGLRLRGNPQGDDIASAVAAASGG
jgi:NAD(P)-dependent dehydrogenase (short-subunit alcohol dehydrogenase family)